MKHLIILFVLLIAKSFCVAQNIEHPTFARSDSPNFHVEGIRVSNDTTYIKCSYAAEAGSWANISPNTYIEDVITRKKYNILRIEGIPFAPSQKHFTENTIQTICLYFPAIDASKINLIELKGEEAFNIYDISLKENYQMVYSPNEYLNFYTTSKKYEDQKDFINAVNFKLKQLEAAKYLYGTQSIFCGSIMYDLNLLYVQMEDYMNAIKWGEGSVDIIEKLPGDFKEDIARIYSSLMADYACIRQFEKALNYGEKSVNLRRFLWGENSPQLAKYLMYVASMCYLDLGNIAKAKLFAKESSSIYGKYYGKQSEQYAFSLANLSEFYRSINAFSEAEEAGIEAIHILEKLPIDSVRYTLAASYHNYSLTIRRDIKNAILYAEKANKLLDTPSFSNNEGRLTMMGNLANLYEAQGDTIQSNAIYNDMIKTYRMKGLLKSRNYVDALIHEAKRLRWHCTKVDYYESLDDFLNNYYIKIRQEILDYYIEALKIKGEMYGTNSIKYAETMNEIGRYLSMDKIFFNIGDADTISSYLCPSTKIIKQHIEQSMFVLSSHERTNYWKMNYMHIFDDLLPAVSYKLQTDSLNALAYDALLFSKGFLLNVETKMRKAIFESEDSSLINMYQELESLLARQDLIVMQPNNNDVELRQIQLRIDYLEEELSKSMQVRKDSYERSTTWKDIKQRLGRADAAVEFGSYKYNDSIFYYALVLKSNSQAPQMIPLFEEMELRTLMSSNFNIYDIGRIVWSPLEDELKEVSNVYFSAVGLLNIVGIEYCLKDKNTYRLSSTNELCEQRSRLNVKEATLFGGLDYEFAEEPSSQWTKTLSDRLTTNLLRDINTRGTFEPLPNTLKEIIAIEKELSAYNVNCQLFSGKNGTENNFKLLSGEKIGILHLSTHGMFVDENSTKSKSELLNIHFLDIDTLVEDRAMTCSFLVMSGGNRLVKHDTIPANDEDGIMTAREISRLDFSSTDLVVLSACKTALGEIASEGVYGLQRGFKKAGVKTILMSLEEVDDEATMIFMVEFYRSLMSGKTKLQSLKDAQKHLRSVENGKYDDPKYWASFIMLDGLN